MISLDKQNNYVLSLVQALLGAVTYNLRVAGLSFFEDRVVLVFVFEKKNDDDLEEVEDVVFEFESLQPGPLPIEVSVGFKEEILSKEDLPQRLVFRRKEII